MKNKFTIEKNYNISIIVEGLDVNKADVEFCLLLDDLKLSLPLKNIKENVFRLKLPSKIKDTLKGFKDINYCINVRDDNLIFEVARSKFELEMFAVKEVTITESDEEDAESIIIETPVIIEEEPIVEAADTTKADAQRRALEDIEHLLGKSKKKKTTDSIGESTVKDTKMD